MSRDGLDALRARVEEDTALALRLHGVPPERFPAEVVRVAGELALEVTEGDLQAAAADGRKQWAMRWMP